MRRYACWPNEKLKSGHFSIAPVQDGEIEAIRVWRNAQMRVLRQDEPISEKAQRDYFRLNVWPAMKELHPRNILLAFRKGRDFVGYGGLVHIDWTSRRAEVSFLLNPEHIEGGATYEELFIGYIDLLKKFAFTHLGLHRLFAETYEFRSAHIEILEANGFQMEGRLRDHVIIEKKFVDSLIHGCLSERT